MKKNYFLILASILFCANVCNAQTYCDSTGNIAIFSNYDGGTLNINVDVNIPNLQIGIVSYENDSVIISGPYVSNITRVIYTGYYNSNNMHCSPWPSVKSITGAPVGTDTIIFLPPAGYANANGYNVIVCNSSCDLTSNQGGCNTADQIAEYFFTEFGSRNFLFHYTQYGCWTGTRNISDGGNCCATGFASVAADFQASITSFCNEGGQCINFSDNSTGNPTSWQWSFPGAVPDTSSLQNPTNICYTQQGSYDVTLIVSDGSASDTMILSNYITVYPSPVSPTLTQSGDTLFATQGFVTYQWYHDSIPIAGATDYFYVVPMSGNYNLIVTDSNGCDVGAGILNVISGEFGAGSLEFGVSVYPNPAHEQFEVISEMGEKEITIYNSIGEKVYSLTTYSKHSSLSPKLPSGIYLLKITSGEKIFTEKIVIDR